MEALTPGISSPHEIPTSPLANVRTLLGSGVRLNNKPNARQGTTSADYRDNLLPREWHYLQKNIRVIRGE